jgi:hypothetical protein
VPILRSGFDPVGIDKPKHVVVNSAWFRNLFILLSGFLLSIF